MRATLREMRPFFAKSLPGILARFYDKVRNSDPSSGIFKDGAMQEVIRMQVQHWDLIAAGDFGAAYASSIARFCEFNQRAGVAPQWYVGCRLMFIADQLMKAVETEVQVPRFGRAAQAARDKKAMMLNTIARANMLDTENVVAFYFGSNRKIRKDAVADASDRFRAIITSLSAASSELESTARALQCRQHHPACHRGRQCLGGRLQQRAIGSVGDRRTCQLGTRDFGAGSGIQPHRLERRAAGR